ncbi:MAG: putative oxidoreductase [Verrucomicrobiales bacterium]|jgi:putative oxidoreductase
MKRFLFDPGVHFYYTSAALALLRMAIGGMMLVGHGWGKLAHFSEKAATFPNPLGFGSTMSLSMTIFAEVICSTLIILGLFTRFAVVPLAFTMFIALFLVHGSDSFAKQELPTLYLVTCLVLFATGAGRYSIDAQIMKKS